MGPLDGGKVEVEVCLLEFVVEGLGEVEVVCFWGLLVGDFVAVREGGKRTEGGEWEEVGERMEGGELGGERKTRKKTEREKEKKRDIHIKVRFEQLVVLYHAPGAVAFGAYIPSHISNKCSEYHC